jgi:dTDP-glucose pyrophosphorylase
MKTMNLAWQRVILKSDATIRDVIQNLNDNAVKIVIIVNETGELAGTISDGDIRRGLLQGLEMGSPITNVIRRNPLVVPATIGRELVVDLMTANKVLQVPVVDEKNHPAGLHLWEDINKFTERLNTMVIMAGGLGKRLRPYTENCPKPMVSVAGRPMLEHIIEKAKIEGFRNFILAIHYLGHMIEDHFGDGSRFDVRIEYLREQTMLGTAGALSLIDSFIQHPFLVTNGDVISDIRYGELLDFHERQNATATMAVRLHEWQHPFGVVEMRGVDIIGFNEKPVLRSHINAGVYVLDPISLHELEKNQPCDMPMLFERLQTKGKRTVAYPMHEPWLDVGRPSDLDQAQSLNY